jgi:Na+-translocating ferredoxin:NAD+ oxidoreductase RnfG subunit
MKKTENVNETPAKPKRKGMPKLVLLPLFLGVVCLLSAGVLVGVNALTAPRIAENEFKKQNEGYLAVLGLDSVEGLTKEEVTPNETLSGVGVTNKVVFKSGEAVTGIVYDALVKGYGGDLKFQVGFKDKNYSGFFVVSQSETPTYGGKLLEQVNDMIKGQPADGPVPVALTDYAGATMTKTPLVKAFEACASDYLATEGV